MADGGSWDPAEAARPGAAAPGWSVYSEAAGATICARVAAAEPARVFYAAHFERRPDGPGLLCAPPRNPAEAQAWIDAYGKPYEPGVGPNGEIRAPVPDWKDGG